MTSRNRAQTLIANVFRKLSDFSKIPRQLSFEFGRLSLLCVVKFSYSQAQNSRSFVSFVPIFSRRKPLVFRFYFSISLYYKSQLHTYSNNASKSNSNAENNWLEQRPNELTHCCFRTAVEVFGNWTWPCIEVCMCRCAPIALAFSGYSLRSRICLCFTYGLYIYPTQNELALY